MSDPNETPKVNNEETSDTGWETLDYREVDTKEYVEAGLADGSLEVFEAVKFARISAERGEVGQEVISWSEDEDGNPIQERVSTVEIDPETGEPGWIATKTDSDGNPIIDKNGHTNQWIIDAKTFRKKYEEDPEHPGIFRPVGGPQKFVQTSENLTISQWGEKMNMPKGSYINITNPDDMYAINPRDFDDTYAKTEQASEDSKDEESAQAEETLDYREVDTPEEILKKINALAERIATTTARIDAEIARVEEILAKIDATEQAPGETTLSNNNSSEDMPPTDENGTQEPIEEDDPVRKATEKTLYENLMKENDASIIMTSSGEWVIHIPNRPDEVVGNRSSEDIKNFEDEKPEIQDAVKKKILERLIRISYGEE